MDEPSFTLKLNERNEVVLIQADEWTILGSREAACREMCRFLEEIDYCGCESARLIQKGAELDSVS